MCASCRNVNYLQNYISLDSIFAHFVWVEMQGDFDVQSESFVRRKLMMCFESIHVKRRQLLFSNVFTLHNPHIFVWLGSTVVLHLYPRNRNKIVCSCSFLDLCMVPNNQIHSIYVFTPIDRAVEHLFGKRWCC